MNWVPKNNSLVESVLNQTDWMFRLKCRACGRSLDHSFGNRKTTKFGKFYGYVTKMKRDGPVWWDCPHCEDMAAMDIVAISTFRIPKQ